MPRIASAPFNFVIQCLPAKTLTGGSTECPKSKLTQEKRSQTVKNNANVFKFSDIIVKNVKFTDKIFG